MHYIDPDAYALILLDRKIEKYCVLGGFIFIFSF